MPRKPHLRKNEQADADHSPAPSDSETRQRLQRVLAAAGLGSRRECEELITEGRVEVDGQVCDQLGTKVDPTTQKILVDGEKLKIARFQYFAVNKPPGVVSTNSDPDGRLRVIDLIRTDFRVYNVGRLDKSSEGLILVTNDGDLANRLTHPKFGVEKTYLVQTVGVPLPEQLEQLEKGVFLAEGKAKAKSARLIKRNRVGAILEIVLAEGRNREIRRLLARIGHKVTRLQRVAIGPLQLDGLPVGEFRKLTLEEVEALKTWKPGRPSGSKHSSRKGRPTGKPKPSDRRGAKKEMQGNRGGSKVAKSAKRSSERRSPASDVPGGIAKGRRGGASHGRPEGKPGASRSQGPKRSPQGRGKPSSKRRPNR